VAKLAKAYIAAGVSHPGSLVPRLALVMASTTFGAHAQAPNIPSIPAWDDAVAANKARSFRILKEQLE
jgi:hypothetical protein